MFFTPDDVSYFAPVELSTREGLKGAIRMSVGTHGRMKCHFDRPIQQNDTVFLTLYKRTYPKFGDCYNASLSSRSGAGAGAGGAGAGAGAGDDEDAL